jgi:uncharacterized protein (TIGR03067 family)
MHAALFTIAALCAAGADDLDDLQGSWKLDRVERRDGGLNPDAGGLVVRGSRITRLEVFVSRGTCKRDETREPRRFETRAVGNNEPSILRGIYRIGQATYTECYNVDVPGKGVPAEFDSKPGSWTTLDVWERADRRDVPPTGSDRARLEGMWRLRSQTVYGMPAGDEGTRGVTLTFRGGEYVRRSEYAYPATLWVVRDGDSRLIDLTSSDIPGLKATIKGLYRRDGDRLMLLLNLTSGERPARFEEKPRPGQGLYLYKRADPKP